MKKILVPMALILLILLVSCATEQKAIQPAFIPQEKCDVPVWNVGDSWRFRRSDMKQRQLTVERIEENLYVVDDYYAILKRCFDKKNLELVAEINREGKKEKVRYATDESLDFPIYVGKKWSKTFRSPPSREGATELHYMNEYQVISYEDVAVPAGTFKAFKIELKQTNYGAKFAYGKVHYWYSPEVKYIVKAEYEKITFWIDRQDYVLIKFELKDKQSSLPEGKLTPEKLDTASKPQTPLPEKPKKSVPATPPPRTNIVSAAGTFADIRSGAVNEFPIINTIRQGDKLTLLGEYGEWFNVRLENGQEGWINGRFVKQ